MHNINPLKTQLNPICHMLALLGVHHILHVSRLRVKHSSAQLAVFRLHSIRVSSHLQRYRVS